MNDGEGPKTPKAGKIYILDTNVLLIHPEAIFSFEENDVVVPIVVIDELDDKKSELNEIGRNARQTVRIIDKFRAEGFVISNGVVLPGGGEFRVEINNDRDKGEKSLISNLDLSKADNRILLVAANLNEKEKVRNPEAPRKVVIVSNDGALRIKAEAVGLLAEEYKTNVISYDTLYTGLGSEKLILPDDVMDLLFQTNSADYLISGAMENQYFDVVSAVSKANTTIRYCNGKIFAVNNFRTGRAYELNARNPGQNLAIDLLMNRDIGMVSLVGAAGTGKTLLAIAAGLDQVNSGHYSRLVVTRPLQSVGRDLGYLPGDVNQKIDPWLRPIYDSIEFLFMNNSKRTVGSFSQNKEKFTDVSQEMISDGVLEIQPLCFVRGITMPNQYFIVDEAQNLTPHEIKTLATRVGEGTKIVLTGDPNQIDSPYLTKDTNGLTYFVDKMKGQIEYGHITLTQGERSRIATICSQLL